VKAAPKRAQRTPKTSFSARGAPVSTPLAYRFADLKLDFGQRRLERDGQPIE
jgi:hypothetical protein